MEPDLQELPLERVGQSDEPQSGRDGQEAVAEDKRIPASIEHVQVPDEGRETRRIAGRGDDGIRRES
jgi:hypothetical protein